MNTEETRRKYAQWVAPKAEALLPAPTGYAPRRWRDGSRVTRELYMDDGTWMRLGDKCLPRSPLRHGVVTRRDPKRWDGVWVRWDGDTKEHHYLDHGIDAEAGAYRLRSDCEP